MNQLTTPQRVAVLVGYPLLFLSLYTVLYYFNVVNFLPTNETLSQWDVGWHKSIFKGYSFILNEECNVAFFPLYPSIWKLLSVDEIGMAIVNYCCFLVMFNFIIKEYSLSLFQTLILISTPPLMFMFVPYSEATFFFFTGMFLLGLKKEKYLWCLLGVFFASLNRSSSLFFVSPFVYILVIKILNKQFQLSVLMKYLLLLIVVGVSIMIVTLLQYNQTGEWFAFYKAQSAWNHKLQFPVFPLYSWGKLRYYFVDAIYSIIGITTLFLLIYHFYCQIFKKVFLFRVSIEWLFSLVMLAEMFVFNFLFQGGSMHSTNRYIGATSFFIVFLIPFFKDFQLNKKYLLIFVGFIALVLISFGAFTSGIVFGVRIVLIVGLFYLSFIYYFTKRDSKSFYVFFIIQLILQIHFFNMFLSGEWVG